MGLQFDPGASADTLVEGLDFYQWPCISGERFPPTSQVGTGGTVTYSTATTFPTLRVNQPAAGSSTSTAAQWPSLPLASPRSGVFSGYTVSCKFYISTLDVNNARFGIYLDPSRLHGIEFNKTGSDGIKTYFNGSPTGGGPCPSLNAWHDLSMSVSADGKSITWTVDGALIRTATNPGSIATFPPTLAVVAINGGSFAAGGHITQIHHEWK